MGSDKVRNVVLVGHSGSGKTTLAEALLHVAGVTTRMGRVEDGNTVTDFEAEEVDRGSSVSLAMAPFDWQGHRINLIDTPGISDFIGEVRAALRAADLALFVVSGVDGVEVQTEEIWRLAGDEGISRAVFVNKLDRERSFYRRTVSQLKASFGNRIAPSGCRSGRSFPPRDRHAGPRGRLHLRGRAEGEAERGPRRHPRRGRGWPRRTGRSDRRDRRRCSRHTSDGTEPGPDELITGMHRGMVRRGGVPRSLRIGDRTHRHRPPRPVHRRLRAPSVRATPPAHHLRGQLPESGTVAYVFKTMSDPVCGPHLDVSSVPR
jgi:small GTP-binding protein